MGTQILAPVDAVILEVINILIRQRAVTDTVKIIIIIQYEIRNHAHADNRVQKCIQIKNTSTHSRT